MSGLRSFSDRDRRKRALSNRKKIEKGERKKRIE
jgi:hypothetical protein